MIDRVLVDTGPLVAFLNRRDRYHRWAVVQLAEIVPPLLTCESVLSEACFLLRRATGGARAVLELVQRGIVSVPFRLEAESEAVARLLVRYTRVPMSLADACLVRMAEQNTGSKLLTLDADFRIYRKSGRQVVPTIMPSLSGLASARVRPGAARSRPRRRESEGAA